MTTYAIFHIGADPSAPPFDLALCEDEAGARDEAMRVLTEDPACRQVEVWDQFGLVFSLDR